MMQDMHKIINVNILMLKPKTQISVYAHVYFLSYTAVPVFTAKDLVSLVAHISVGSSIAPGTQQVLDE